MQHIEKIYPSDIEKNKKIGSLSRILYTYRDQHEEYGHYLLEKKPGSHYDVAQDLLVSLDKNLEHHRLYIIKDEINKEVWYILLKNYSDYIIDDPISWHKMSSQIIPNLEASYRTIRKWTCTPSIKHALYDVLHNGNTIQSIMWHHAVANKSSGCVFHSNGFSVVKYHPDYVYLPNIDQYSDTILRKLDRKTYIQDLLNHHEDLKQYLRAQEIRTCDSSNWTCKNLQEWYLQMQSKRAEKSLSSKKFHNAMNKNI